MSLFSKRSPRTQLPEEPPYHPVWSNLMLLFLTNFKLIPFFVPSMICLGMLLLFGGLIFLAAGLLLLIPAGPAVCAMYDVSFQLVRRIDKHERRTFFQSYRANLRQGMLTMAVQLPFLASLLLMLLVQGEKPLWVTLCVILGGVMLMSFSILAFSQVALVALPLKNIWNNALLLIPLTHWRVLLGAVVQLLFLAALYQWVAAAIVFFLFLVPALLICWTAKLLWPGLEPLLVRDES